MSDKLHKYCHEGNYDKVKKQLAEMERKGVNIPAKLSQKLGVFGYTPLHDAATEGHPKVLHLLIQYGGVVNSKASSGYTPLHLAASAGHVDCVRVLVEGNADINEKDDYRQSPLQSAERGARSDVVRVLRSAAIIKAVETNSVALDSLLRVQRDSLEADCLQRALMVAVTMGNAVSAGKLISKGKESVDLDVAFEKAKEIKAFAVQGLLLMVKATQEDDHLLILTLFGLEVPDYRNPLIEYPDFPLVQNAVKNREVSTTVAIDIARRKQSTLVREELLMRTDVNKAEGVVGWYGLRLTDIEISWFKRIHWVKKLQLAKNEFRCIPSQIGNYLKNVVKLNLQYNILEEFPRCLLELPSIQELNLSYNKLQDIPEVHEWSNSLTVVDLSHNELSTLPLYCEAPNLKRLSLSHNKFRQVPMCVCSFTNLQHLELGHNPDILSLPVEMGRLQNLSFLDLEGLNDINDPPKSIRGEAKHCINFLNQKLRSTQGYYRMKLMLVGKQERGKTTLVARLQGRDVKESDNQSTVGIDVSEWRCSPRTIGKQFTFNIWDFGGQEEYYATHQCFLTERSLYLLVWNITHGEEGIKELKPWLDNIALRAPHSRVIIVATHYDKVSEEDRSPDGVAQVLLQNVATLAGNYAKKLQIHRVTFVGLHGRLDNLEHLKKLIYDAAAEYTINGDKVMGRSIPASYHALDTHLAQIQKDIRQNQGNPIMHAPEFRDMIRSRNLADIYSDEEVKTATLFLCEVGSLLHYDDRKNNLDDLYFVDPRWLCDMMSTVVTIEQRNPYVKNGIIHHSSLPLLYRGKQFPTEFLEQYLVLLDRFEVALPLDQDKNLILIPSMLPDVRPDDIDKPDDHVCYERYIQFDVPTPPGFWSRLLARIMHTLACIRSLLELPCADIIKSFIEASPKVVEEEQNNPQKQNKPKNKPRVKTQSVGVFERSYSAAKRRSLPNPASGEFLSSGGAFGIGEGTVIEEESKPEISNPHITLPLPQPMISHEGKVLKYWKTGICYRKSDLYLLVEELEGTVDPELHGVHIVVTPGVEGCTAYGQVVDLVVNLVEEWYSGLLKTKGSCCMLDQLILCIECLKEKREDPFKFEREDLIRRIKDKEPEIECPSGKHVVLLVDLAPDLFLADIDRRFVLEQEELKFSREDEERLGTGAFGSVFRGHCRGQSVAVKLFLSDGKNDSLESFNQLRTEAQVLKRNNHPCLVSMVGVLVFPYPALVMEEAPMGSLDVPLVKKKIPISRVVLFRIAAQIASALKFLHGLSYIYRDLKAANVLLWSLELDQLINCKLADFGIVASAAPIGVKGAQGTVGFIAPEVAYVGANHSRATYDFKADIFSYGMTLYQMISRRNPYYDVKHIHISPQIEQGKRPKFVEFPVSRTGLYFMTSLMKRCWKQSPTDRPSTYELIPRLMNPRVQLTMGIHHIESSSRMSLRTACCCVLYSHSKPYQVDYSEPPTVEFWICCDNYKGAEIFVYEANSMALLKRHQINNNQIGYMSVCGDNVWVASRAGLEYGVNEIYKAASHQLKHRIRLRDTTVSTVACNNTHVFIGTMEGYVFKYETAIALLKPEDYRPEKRCLTQHCIDGLVVIGSSLWLSHTKQMLFCSVKTLDIEASKTLSNDEPGKIGHIAVNDRKTLVWSSEPGSPIIRAWRAQQQTIAFNLAVGDILIGVDSSIGQQDAVTSRICCALDTVWCGMATGHIMVFSEDRELLLHFRPYEDYIRFLVPIPSSGPCGKEDCMVLSGGKNYIRDAYLEDVSDDANVPDIPKESTKLPESPMGSTLAGTVILWEALKASHMRQVNILSEGDVWRSHKVADDYKEKCKQNTRVSSNSVYGRSDLKVRSTSPSRHRVRTQSYAMDKLHVCLPGEKKTVIAISKPVILKKLLSEISSLLKAEVTDKLLIHYKRDGKVVKISNQEMLGEYLTFKERPEIIVSRDRSTPGTEAPTVPEIVVHTVPETEAPTVPEIVAPTVPEIVAPTVPETVAPTISEVNSSNSNGVTNHSTCTALSDSTNTV